MKTSLPEWSDQRNTLKYAIKQFTPVKYVAVTDVVILQW